MSSRVSKKPSPQEACQDVRLALLLEVQDVGLLAVLLEGGLVAVYLVEDPL